MLDTMCSAAASPVAAAAAIDPLRLSFRQTLLAMAAGTNSSMMSARCPGCDTNADTSTPGGKYDFLWKNLCCSAAAAQGQTQGLGLAAHDVVILPEHVSLITVHMPVPALIKILQRICTMALVST